MFEVGWTEMLVIAVVMIVVVGPKDLPRMLRQFGRTTAKLRVMAGDFRKQFDEALKEAELDDVKSSVDSLRSLNPAAEIRKQINPFQQAAQDVRAGLESAMKPKPSVSAEPAVPVAHPAEPLKAGPVEMPSAGPPPIIPDILKQPAVAASPASVSALPEQTPAAAEPAPPPVAEAEPKSNGAHAALKTVNGSGAAPVARPADAVTEAPGTPS